MSWYKLLLALLCCSIFPSQGFTDESDYSGAFLGDKNVFRLGFAITSSWTPDDAINDQLVNKPQFPNIVAEFGPGDSYFGRLNLGYGNMSREYSDQLTYRIKGTYISGNFMSRFPMGESSGVGAGIGYFYESSHNYREIEMTEDYWNSSYIKEYENEGFFHGPEAHLWFEVRFWKSVIRSGTGILYLADSNISPANLEYPQVTSYYYHSEEPWQVNFYLSLLLNLY